MAASLRAPPLRPFDRGDDPGRPLRHDWLIHWLNMRAVSATRTCAMAGYWTSAAGRSPTRAPLDRVTDYVGLEHPDTAHARDRIDVWGDAQTFRSTTAPSTRCCAFHVIEHTAQPTRVMAEAARVLRPDGILLLAVPFMWGIHEAPRDFYRFTPYALLTSTARRTHPSVDRAAVRLLGDCRASPQLYGRSLGPRPLRVPVLAFVSALQGVGFVLDRLDPVETTRPAISPLGASLGPTARR